MVYGLSSKSLFTSPKFSLIIHTEFVFSNQRRAYLCGRCSGHWLADTTNQVFLLLGLRFYKRPASEKHPFGYGKERFFWSFIADIFILTSDSYI